MSKGPNYYTLLGLPLDATADEIRRAYREAALRLHPDRNTRPGETELFLDVQKAYEVLCDPEKRAQYDSALPPEETVQPPVSVTVQYSRNLIPLIQEPQLIYVLLDIAAHPGPEFNQAPPLNVCLIIDSSTSMQGPYMDTVKSTAIELVRQLRPQDSLSLVAFNDFAKVLVPAGSNENHNTIETNIRMLRTGGGTEMLKGIQAGFNETRKNRRDESVNHMILLTDGVTYGDEPACLEIAAQAAAEGIGISTMGIGSKWNDNFLDNLATTTGGYCMYVSEPRDIKNFLRRKFFEFGKSYADQVALKLNVSEEIKLNYTFRLEPEALPLDVESPIHLGYLPDDGSLLVVLEFFIDRLPIETGVITLATGQVSFNIPSRENPSYTTRVHLELPIGESANVQLPPVAIVQALARMNLYRMQDQIQKDLDNGESSAAAHRMQYLATNLLSQGQHDLAKTVMAEADRLQQKLGFSEEGKKRIKYGTRSLAGNIPPFAPQSDVLKKGGSS